MRALDRLISFVFSIYLMIDLERIKKYINNVSSVILGENTRELLMKNLSI